MDTITHGIAGALVAKASFSEREGHWATVAITLGAVFPDSDTLANLFISDELARLEFHRGITHSLVALPVFALLLATLLFACSRQRKWLRYSIFAAIGIGLHILLDVITSFGTMVWMPLSRARVSWDITFIIDLVLTMIVLLPQLISWVYSDRQRAWRRGLGVWLGLTAAGILAWRVAASLQIGLSLWTVFVGSLLLAVLLSLPWMTRGGFRWRASFYCRIGVGTFATYLGCCAVAHQVALARVEAFAQRAGLHVERLAALPAPPSLRQWSGLVQTPEGVYRLALDLSKTQPRSSRFFAQASRNRYLETAEDFSDVQTYLWFARFPWVTYREHDGLHIIEYRDLQFYWRSFSNYPPFTFQLSLDRQGRLVHSELLGP